MLQVSKALLAARSPRFLDEFNDLPHLDTATVVGVAPEVVELFLKSFYTDDLVECTDVLQFCRLLMLYEVPVQTVSATLML